MPPVGKERALALLLDAALLALAIAAVALASLALLFLLGSTGALLPAGWAAFALFLIGLLLRDATGGFSRKWLGYRLADERGRNPGVLRSVARNLPLLLPGWNLYEIYRVLKDGDAPRSLDRVLRLRREPEP